MMTVTSYARIENGIVAELFNTSQPIDGMFCPELTWVPVPAGAGVVPGWVYDGTSFAAPSPQAQTSAMPPTIAELQAQLSALATQINALKS
jgi:hypothetical protein